MLHDAGANKEADKIANLIGDMEPPLNDEGVREMSDTPRTDAAVVSAEYIRREMDYYTHKFVIADHMRDVERELAAAIAQRDEKDRQLADCYNRMCNAESQRDKLADALRSCMNGVQALADQFDSVGIPCGAYHEALKQAHEALKDMK
jgi:replicative DNA helicase